MSKDNYIVSALKYRPSTWDRLVGQSNISSTLQHAIKSGHLAQAYLFCGPRGVGKTTVARLFAKSINQFDDNDHKDFSYNIFELDAASNNSVEDIRSITDQVRIPPQIGKYKVYIIDEVHMLTQAAFNAFLKTLEEPPQHAVFILATTEKHKIIPTILSRCQVYDFHRITIKDIAAHLAWIAKEENVKADSDALHIIAEKADGALRDALSVFDQMVNFCNSEITYDAVISNLNILDHDYYFKISEVIIKNNIPDALLLFDEILLNGFDGHHFINGLGNHFRNLLVCKDKVTLKLLETGDATKSKYLDQSSIFKSQLIVDALRIISDADINYKVSKNQRLHIELALMKLCSLTFTGEKKKTFDYPIIPPQLFQKIEKSALDHKISEESTKKIAVYSGKLTTEEDHSTHVVKPIPTSWKSKRVVSTSIYKMKEEIGKLLEENEIEEDLTNKPRTLFSDKELLNVWCSFAEIKKKNGKQGLYTTLTRHHPELKSDDFVINFDVDSKVQQMELQSEKTELLSYLRKKLNNYAIKLNIIVLSIEQTTMVHLNSKDRFMKMAEKNSSINILRDKFNLDLEY